MSGSAFSKDERSRLRELAGEVYETELGQLLEELDAEFARWRVGELPASELLAAIEDFQQNQAHELGSLYRGLKEPELVARGIAQGLLPRAALDPVLLAKLDGLVAGCAPHGG
ncbi:hypothetical protein [Coralloluteibacterium thermophilus]|uniref:Uncharacterized protein n=1 Tax=Coralloluteibacterium thermophilum TaxID=2707049 RepID=A0ABV9NM90_9GAMM